MQLYLIEVESKVMSRLIPNNERPKVKKIKPKRVKWSKTQKKSTHQQP